MPSCETGTRVMPGDILQRPVADILARHRPGELEIINPRRECASWMAAAAHPDRQ